MAFALILKTLLEDIGTDLLKVGDQLFQGKFSTEYRDKIIPAVEDAKEKKDKNTKKQKHEAEGIRQEMESIADAGAIPPEAKEKLSNALGTIYNAIFLIGKSPTMAALAISAARAALEDAEKSVKLLKADAAYYERKKALQALEEEAKNKNKEAGRYLFSIPVEMIRNLKNEFSKDRDELKQHLLEHPELENHSLVKEILSTFDDVIKDFGALLDLKIEKNPDSKSQNQLSDFEKRLSVRADPLISGIKCHLLKEAITKNRASEILKCDSINRVDPELFIKEMREELKESKNSLEMSKKFSIENPSLNAQRLDLDNKRLALETELQKFGRSHEALTDVEDAQEEKRLLFAYGDYLSAQKAFVEKQEAFLSSKAAASTMGPYPVPKPKPEPNSTVAADFTNVFKEATKTQQVARPLNPFNIESGPPITTAYDKNIEDKKKLDDQVEADLKAQQSQEEQKNDQVKIQQNRTI